jgi:hypothetical protein
VEFFSFLLKVLGTSKNPDVKIQEKKFPGCSKYFGQISNL